MTIPLKDRVPPVARSCVATRRLKRIPRLALTKSCIRGLGLPVAHSRRSREPRALTADRVLVGDEDGTHNLPIAAQVRRTIGKEAGEKVVIRLEERIDK